MVSREVASADPVGARMRRKDPTDSGQWRAGGATVRPRGVEDARLSKKLSWLLRHGAVKRNVAIFCDGFVPVDEILGLSEFRGITASDIDRIVSQDSKQRYSLRDDASGGMGYIRANQGHSITTINPHELLQQISHPEEVPVCVHGTSQQAWEKIKGSGLKKMSRNHVHFAAGLPGEDGVISGMRATAEIMIYIDCARAMADGIRFFRSENNVLLSPGLAAEGGIPPKYFSRVVDVSTHQDILFSSREERGPNHA